MGKGSVCVLGGTLLGCGRVGADRSPLSLGLNVSLRGHVQALSLGSPGCKAWAWALPSLRLPGCQWPHPTPSWATVSSPYKMGRLG